MEAALTFASVLLVSAVIVGLAWYFSDRDPATQQFRRARRTFIDDVQSEETVVLVGRLRGAEPISAPLSGRTCIGYIAAIQRNFNPNDPDAAPGREVKEKRLTAVVWLEDETGTVPITIQGDLDIEYSYDDVTYLRDLPMAHVDAFLEKRGASYDDIDPGFPFGVSYTTLPSDYRGVEWRIDDGDPVAVVGQARNEPCPGTGGNYRSAPEHLVLGCAGRLPLTLILTKKEIEHEQHRRRRRATSKRSAESVSGPTGSSR